MERINYKETITLKEDITELVSINIDDHLITKSEDDCIEIGGEIIISGQVKYTQIDDTFVHPISVSILLSKDNLTNENVNITIEDFNYTITNNTIELELFLKLSGLKEVDPYFPAQEDQESLPVVKDYPMEEKAKEESLPKKSSLLSQIFSKDKIKTKRCYLIHVVTNETTYEEIANTYNIETSTLKEYNANTSLYPSKLIFIPKSK